MNQQKLEALLFVAGDEGITLEQLSFLLKEPTATVYEQLQVLNTSYQENEASALEILEVDQQFMLATKKSLAPLLKDYAQTPQSNRLTQAALETLAIVAYKQPITRGEIDEIRGVNSAGSLQKLVERGLLMEKGRAEGPGRPILYGTSSYFMDYFGLKTLEELPNLQELEQELAEDMPDDLFYDRFGAEATVDEETE